MEDKIQLLNNLRLEPGTRSQTSSRRVWLVTILTGLGLAAIGMFSATYFSHREAAIPASFVMARNGQVPDGSGASTTALDASGYVVARRQATVAAKITARVMDISIEEGMHVAAGQIMARLDDSNTRAALNQAQAQVAQAEANLSAARIAFEDEKPVFNRSQELAHSGWVSHADLDAARAHYDAAESNLNVAERSYGVAKAALKVAESNEEDTIVRAPFDGVISVKAAQQGEVVSPLSAGAFTRTGIGTLVDMNSLEVEVDVSESYIDRVHVGQDATVWLNAYHDWPIPANVIAIIPTADRSKATVKVRVGFKQKDQRILPEMGARVAFLTQPGPIVRNSASGALIPIAAVKSTGENAAVFLIHENKLERRPVTLGPRAGLDVTVLTGVVVGDIVAVGDLSKFTDGATVRRADEDKR